MNFIKTQFTGSYYVANIIQNILKDIFGYLPMLAGFCGDAPVSVFFETFPKESALHKFIMFILDYDNRDELIEESHENYNRKKFDTTPIEYWLKAYKIKHIPYKEWIKDHKEQLPIDTIDSYYDELTMDGTLEELYQIRSKEIFFILFQNREICMLLSEYISSCIANYKQEDSFDDDLFLENVRKDGCLKRRPIPNWVKKAIFFRDRGRCVFCNKDLSGKVSLNSKPEYDHIIPLKNGGFNDIINLQLVCSSCNKKKSAKFSKTSIEYENWYE